jgi:hypothetical protein
MNDAEFLRALECCTLPPGEFGHQGHVRAAFLYLQQGEFAEALQRMRRAIRNFATHQGSPDRYHETMTVAFVALIHEHMRTVGADGGWQAFAANNPQLLGPGVLSPFYTQAELDSPLARSVFLLPRAAAGHAPRQELRTAGAGPAVPA